MKKLLLFGSFFIISFVTALVGESSGVQADSYTCQGSKDCPEGYISDYIGSHLFCCIKESSTDTGHWSWDN